MAPFPPYSAGYLAASYLCLYLIVASVSFASEETDFLLTSVNRSLGVYYFNLDYYFFIRPLCLLTILEIFTVDY